MGKNCLGDPGRSNTPPTGYVSESLANLERNTKCARKLT